MAVVAVTQESFTGGPQQTFVNIPGSQLTCAGQMNCLMCHKDVWISCQPQGHVLVVLHHGNAPTSGDDYSLSTELNSRSSSFSEMTHERHVNNSDAVASSRDSIGVGYELEENSRNGIDIRSTCSLKMLKSYFENEHSYSNGGEGSGLELLQFKADVVNVGKGGLESEQSEEKNTGRLSVGKKTRSLVNCRTLGRKDSCTETIEEGNNNSSQTLLKEKQPLEKTTVHSGNSLNVRNPVTLQTKTKKEGPNQSKSKRDRGATHFIEMENAINKHSIRYYHCVLCNSQIKRKTGFKRHLRHHIEPKGFVCDVCGKAFRLANILNRHKTAVHESLRPFSCDVCGKGFPNKCEVNKHRNIHLGLKLHVCHLCGKSYSFRCNLARHMNHHSGNKGFSCKFCDKKFTRKASMLVHQMRHTEETPYFCEVCGKGFRRSKNLHKHLEKHAKEKTLLSNSNQCHICGRDFCSISSKNRHLLIHSGERPHQCEICGKSFSQKSNMTAHMKTHHTLISGPGKQCGS